MNSPTTSTLAEPGAAGFLATVAGASGRRPAGALSATFALANGPLPDFSQLLSRGTGSPLAPTVPAVTPVMNPAPANGAAPVSPLPMMLGQLPAAGAGEETGPAVQPTRETVEAAGAILLSLWQALTSAPATVVPAGNEGPAIIQTQPDAPAPVPAATARVIESLGQFDLLPPAAETPPALHSQNAFPDTARTPTALPGQAPVMDAAMTPTTVATPSQSPAQSSALMAEKPFIPAAPVSAATAPAPISTLTSTSTSTLTSTPTPTPTPTSTPTPTPTTTPTKLTTTTQTKTLPVYTTIVVVPS